LAEGTPLAEAGIELVPYGDSIALGNTLARTLTARNRWQELHERNLEVHEKYFSWSSIATKLIDALDIGRSSP
jgi:glycosyltransferase involved in cell wall biosynthesis